jgi:hypothetical protein
LTLKHACITKEGAIFQPRDCRRLFIRFFVGGAFMTITRVGTNAKYASGWEAAFLGKRGGKNAAASKKKAVGKKGGKKTKK